MRSLSWRIEHAAWLLTAATLTLTASCASGDDPEPKGEAPDTRIARLAPVTVPAGLAVDGTEPGDLPVVGVATASDLGLALHLSPGKCAVVAKRGTAAATRIGAEAPTTTEYAPDAPRQLPTSAASALGPSTSAAAPIEGGGKLLLTCGSRGLTVLVSPAGELLKTRGAAGAKVLASTGDAESTQLVAAGADDMVATALR